VKKKLVSELRFLLVNYLLGPFLGVLICLLEAFGRIRFLHFERFPIWEEKMIIISNHPSLLEPVILPLIGFPWMNFPWVFSPLWSQIRFSFRWFKELQKEFTLQKISLVQGATEGVYPAEEADSRECSRQAELL